MKPHAQAGALAVGAWCALSLAACSDEGPTGAVITVVNGEGAVKPEAVLARVFGPRGLLYDTQRFPVTMAGPGLGTLAVHRKGDDLDLRVQAVGTVAENVALSEGVLRVTLQPGRQTEATLTLARGRLADGDDDTVPDEIDVCPRQRDVRQDPSSCPDGGPAPDARGR